MLKKAINTGALILFAVWVSVLGFEALTASQQIPSEQQNHRANTAERNAGPIKSAALDQSHPAEQTAQRKTKQQQAAHGVKEFFIGFLEIKLTDLVIAVFTIVLGIKTAGLFRETSGLRDAAEKQRIDTLRAIGATELAADAAQASAETAKEQVAITKMSVIDLERAYLAIYPSQITTDFIPKNTDRYINSDPLQVSVVFRMHNTGRTGANVRKIYGVFGQILPSNDLPIYSNGGETAVTDFVIAAEREDILTPLSFITRLVGEQFFWGYVEYRDIFKNVRTTRFCTKIIPAERGRPGRFEIVGKDAWRESD
jgi:hypothetical protein